MPNRYWPSRPRRGRRVRRQLAALAPGPAPRRAAGWNSGSAPHRCPRNRAVRSRQGWAALHVRSTSDPNPSRNARSTPPAACRTSPGRTRPRRDLPRDACATARRGVQPARRWQSSGQSRPRTASTAPTRSAPSHSANGRDGRQRGARNPPGSPRAIGTLHQEEAHRLIGRATSSRGSGGSACPALSPHQSLLRSSRRYPGGARRGGQCWSCSLPTPVRRGRSRPTGRRRLRRGATTAGRAS